jgi:hypothetical protein
MRYLSVISLSIMMVAVLAVAGKPAQAQDSESDDSVPALAPGAEDVSAELAPPAATEEEARPRRKRRPKPVEEAPAEVQEPTKFGGPAAPNHFLQTGLSIMPGTGYRLIVRYNDNQYCGDSSGIGGKPICAHRLPTFLDVQLAFGAMTRMDIVVDLRFALEEDPAISDSHQFALAPGLRFWLDQERAFKFYTTLQFVYDYTDFSGSPGVASNDFGLRNANGLMYDPIRNVGFFVQFGESIGFRRWFRIDIDVGLGAQIRFP